MHQLQSGLTVAVTVTNTGTSGSASSGNLFTGEAEHSVLLFITDEVRTITAETKMLKHFARVRLAPGHSEIVTFTVDKKDMEVRLHSSAAPMAPLTYRACRRALTPLYLFGGGGCDGDSFTGRTWRRGPSLRLVSSPFASGRRLKLSGAAALGRATGLRQTVPAQALPT